MEVGAVAGAGAADLAHRLPGLHRLAGVDEGGMEHVQVDVAAVVHRAVDDQAVAAAVGVEALAAGAVDDDPVPDRDQRGPRLDEDVLPLVDVARAVGAEPRVGLAEVGVVGDHGEVGALGQPGRGAGVEQRVAGQRGGDRAARPAEHRHRKPERRRPMTPATAVTAASASAARAVGQPSPWGRRWWSGSAAAACAAC